MNSNNCKCQDCGNIAVLQTYFDRHGDPHLLCPDCYTLALEGDETPEQRNRDWIGVFLLLFAAAAVVIYTSGCSTTQHRVDRTMVAGKVVEIHTDAPDSMIPAVCVEPWAGCYDKANNRIFMRSPVAIADLDHEKAHAAGMEHGHWRDYYLMRCAQVVTAGGKYKVGQMICKRGRGEEVFTDATFSKLERS